MSYHSRHDFVLIGLRTMCLSGKLRSFKYQKDTGRGIGWLVEFRDKSKIEFSTREAEIFLAGAKLGYEETG